MKGKGLGVYAKASLSDGNPNVIRSSLVGGLYDSFGAGYFNYDFSDQLQDALEPVLGFGNEQGLEVFYNFALARWCHIGADLQVLNPATRNSDVRVFGGLRANIVF